MLLPLLLVAAAVSQSPCAHEETRTAQLTGASSLDVDASAGTLRIEGRAGVNAVRIEAHLCASSAALLEDMELDAEVSRGTARVTVDLPDHMGNRRYARMDLVIVVPQGMPARIDDGSGATWISGLGDAEINDGSGELTVEDMRGSVEIIDGSGAVGVTDVAGSLTIEDGSGELTIRGVRGAVRIEDGSGSIEVADSGSDVEIDDGSGSIDVARVAGSLTVSDDGSGRIRHRDVQGRVSLPRH
jgi:hypothetical protein